MILIGAAAGYLAKRIMPGEEGGGFLLTTLLGIAGGVVGGLAFGMIGIQIGQGVIGKLIGAVIGALIILWVYNKFFAKKSA